MARIRTIKPEFWAHEDLSSLPEPVHILAAALLNYADDEGYFNANTQLVKACCFPIREPSVTITVGLLSLSGIGYIRVGKGEDGKMYGHILKFKDHQVINKPKKSKIAVMSIDWALVPEEYRTNTVVVPEEYREEWKGMEGNGREQGMEETPPVKMTLSQIRNTFRTIIGSELGGGVNQSLSEICQSYTPETIEYAILTTSTRTPKPTNPFMYFKSVLEGRADNKAGKSESERDRILAANAESCREFAGGV